MLKKYLVLLCGLFLMPSQSWAAAITVPFSGTILDEGVAYEGTGYFKVAICTEAGTTLWSNDGTSTDCSEPTADVDAELTAGIYSFMLGDTDLMNELTTDAVNLNDKLKLRTWFSSTGTGSFDQFSPDVILGTVVRAGIADTLQGYGPDDFLMADSQIVAGNIADGAITAAKLGTDAVTSISGNAGTATALAADPTDCSAGTFATTIAASGSLTCAAVTSSHITDGEITNADMSASAAIAFNKLAALPEGKVLVGSGSNVATSTGINGDASLTGTGSLTIADNSVDGTDIALGSDTAGDVMYYDGTDWIRLPKGSDGQVLTLASGVPSWAAASGGGISYTTKTITTGVLGVGMSGTDVEDFNITGVFNTGIIDYITVTQVDDDDGGGNVADFPSDSLKVLIYTSDVFDTYEGALIGSDMGSYMLTAAENTADTIRGFRSVYGGSTVNAPVPYFDADNTSELHIRVENEDFSDEGKFQITLKIREIS
ncbi:MAG: Kelch repeat protein [uncultured bacterium]|nr:MAG: Kelch repeat protein [uncultured bacterium]